MRRTRVVGAVAAAIVVVLGVLLAAGLFPQELLRAALERALSAATGGRAHVGSLHVVPALLRARARDVSIEAPGYAFDVAELEVELGPGAVAGRLELARLVMRRPTLRLEPAALAPGTGPARVLPRVFVGSLHIDDGRLLYVDATAGTLALDGLAASGGIGTGRLELRAASGSWSRGEEQRTLHALDARLDAARFPQLALERLELALGDSRLEASGPLGRLPGLEPELDWNARVALHDLASFAAPDTLLEGTLALAGRGGLSGDTPWVDARLSADALRWGDWEPTHVEGQAELRGSDGTLSASARLAGGRTRLSASMAAGRLRAEAQGNALQLAELARVLGVETTLTGAGDLRLVAEGPWEDHLAWTLDTSLTGRYAERPLDAAGRAEGTWTAAGGRIVADWSARGTLPEGSIRLKGRLEGLEPLLLQADLDGLVRDAEGTSFPVSGRVSHEAGASLLRLNAQPWGGTLSIDARLLETGLGRLDVALADVDLALGVPDATGHFGLRASLSGPLDALDGEGRATVAGLAWQGRALGDLDAELRARGGVFEGTAQLPAAGIAGTLRIVPRDDSATAVLALDATPLSILGAPAALEGALSGEVELHGALGNLGEAVVQAELEGAGLVLGTPWQTEAPVVVVWRDGRLETPGARLSVGAGQLGLVGSFAPDAEAPLDLRITAEADLAQVPLEGTELAGWLEARLEVSGSTSLPRLDGSVTLRDGTVQRPGLPALAAPRASLRFDGTRTHVEIVDARIAGGSVSLAGEVPLAALWPAARVDPERVAPNEGADLRLTWRGLDVAALGTASEAGGGAWRGSVDGEAHIQGGLARLEEWRVTATLPDTQLQVGDLAVSLSTAGVALESGRLSTTALSLATPEGTFRSQGSVDLRSGALDLRGAGRLALGALSPWLEETTLRGIAEVELEARGTLAAPELEGSVRLAGASVRVDTVPHPLTDITGTLRLTGTSLRLEEGRARLGGGSLTFSGGAVLDGATLTETHVDIVGRDLALRYPEGLRSRMNADLTLTGRSGAFMLSGGVRAERGLYDLDVAASAEERPVSEMLTEGPSLLASIGLDITVWISRPILVRNNLARLAVSGRLQFRGDLARPAPFGRLDLLPGGELVLQDRTFRLESGGLTYDGTWDPEVDARAQATIRETVQEIDYLISVDASGTLERPRVSLSSVPALSEREIISLVATGRGGMAAIQSSAWVAGEQAAAFLAGRLTRSVARELEGLGFDEVSIQPELLARETNPGAKFTFGKRLSRYLRLIYSFSLSDAEDRFVQVEGLPGYGVTLLAQRRNDGTLEVGAGQRLSLGGARRPTAPEEERTRLASVTFAESPPELEPMLRAAIEARPGRRVTIWDLQGDADALRRVLRERGYIEAEVGARLEGAEAVFDVRPGSRYAWRVVGMDEPADLAPELRLANFEEDALQRGRARLLRQLHERGHLRASIETRVHEEGGVRHLVFEAQPGPRLEVAQLRFPGASLMDRGELTRAAGGAARLVLDPEGAREGLRDAYARRHHLAANVGPVEVTERNGRVWLDVPVDEGPRARIAEVALTGVEHEHEEVLRWADLPAGTPYDDAAVWAAADRIREGYTGQGYADARVVPRVAERGSDVTVSFEIDAGDQVRVGSVEFVGLKRINESLVRDRLGLEPGDPLDLHRLVAGERRLLELGAFERVAVSHSGNPATLRVEVEERARLALGYRGRYNDDRGASGEVDVELRNLLGRGVALGLRHAQGRDDRETRGSLQFPALVRGDLTVSAFHNREDLPISDEADAPENTRTRTGVELQQNLRLPDHWGLLLGYRFQRSTFRSPVIIVERPPDYVSSVNATLLRETRDNPLDARRGRFWSVNVELSPRAFGSDQDFVKGFVQAFFAQQLSPSWGWAHGYRFGLSHVFDDEPLSPFERYSAGGAYSVRGFATDSLGPRNFAGEPARGEALLVFNQELRYRHASGLGAAAFVDAGNVFERRSDLSLDLRVAAGAGLRWESPIGLLRLDLAFPLDRREDEKRYRLHFSIGQAF